MKIRIPHTLILLLILVTSNTLAQNKEVINKADYFFNNYEFEKAIKLYNNVLTDNLDSTLKINIQEKIIKCENGISLLQYSTKPIVVTSKKVNIKDFFLNIKEFKDSSWIDIPNPFTKNNSHKYYPATYFPNNSNKVYFSAQDDSGSWNIYFSEKLNDTLWTSAELLNEVLTSSGNEILPIISANGKELYFASDGHPGMGGYDVFVSKWDDNIQDWGTPENIGFPYSSNEDDILFYNSPNEQFSIIVSSRGNRSKDSLSIFVTEYQSNPIKTEVTEIEEIKKLHSLKKDLALTNINIESEIGKDNSMDQYSQLVAQMRILQKKLDENLIKQEESRNLYSTLTNQDDKKLIEEKIATFEEEAIAIKINLDTAIKNVQDAEMDFLAKGIIPQIKDPESVIENINKPSKEYEFGTISKKRIPLITIEQPIPRFDFSFKIGKTAQIVEDNTLPEGIVYQIQLFVVSSKASLKSLKGLSPVFEVKQKSGKYLYSVGLFYSHAEALASLNKVRKNGFPGAYIIAFNNSKNLSVRDARIIEKNKKNNVAYQVLINGYTENLPGPIISAIEETSHKDIAKTISDGNTIYIIGPFDKKADSEYLIQILNSLGVENITLKQVKL